MYTNLKCSYDLINKFFNPEVSDNIIYIDTVILKAYLDEWSIVDSIDIPTPEITILDFNLEIGNYGVQLYQYEGKIEREKLIIFQLCI